MLLPPPRLLPQPLLLLPALVHRAFLKAPSILLFDEATSALDSKTEKQVLEALSQLAAGRTSIFVAHRLSTAAQCDQIVVLEDGRVAEAGSHGELLEAGGRYAQLWARQASVDDVYDSGGTDAEGSEEKGSVGGSSSSGAGGPKGGGGTGGKLQETAPATAA
jgi:ABC transporter ATM